MIEQFLSLIEKPGNETSVGPFLTEKTTINDINSQKQLKLMKQDLKSSTPVLLGLASEYSSSDQAPKYYATKVAVL